MIYLDNAATTGKKPETVIFAVENALRRFSANPGRSGHALSQQAAMEVYKARQKTAEMFAASGAENVCFTANCTASLNYVIKGALKENDHIIVSDLEHNAVMRPIYKTGIDYSVARVSLTDDFETLKNFENLIKDNTKMIICTGASNVLGKRLPIKEIGKLCRKHGLLFAVDAAQTAGVIPIDMKEMNIDYLCVAPHKGLYAPMGLGILIAEAPMENTLIEGGTGTDSVNFSQPDYPPERFESGTVNLPAIAGLSAGIDFVKCHGIKKLHLSEQRLIEMLYNELYVLDNIELYAPYPSEEMFVPVLSFNVKGKASGEIAEILNKNGIAVRAGLHCAPTAHKRMDTLETGAVRVCAGAFNGKNDIEYLLKIIKKIK